MTKRAFDHCSHDYASYRPPYPKKVYEIVDRVSGGPTGNLAADVGAGTGIFTRVLASRGWRVVAIEPALSMLGHIPADHASSGAGHIDRLCATAEATGLRSQSVGLVTCTQSFHWFNPPFALAEFARIIRPGGALVLVWNNRDRRNEFVSQFEELVGKWNPSYRREYRRQDWATKVADAGGFVPLTGTTLESIWEMNQEDFIGFTRSVSYIRNVLSRQDRPTFEHELRQLLRSHFGQSACQVPLVTEIWWATRRHAGLTV